MLLIDAKLSIMTNFQIEKDAIAFLGLMSVANAKFDKQFKHQDGEQTHTKGLNIFAAIIDNIDGEVIAQQRNCIHSFNNPMLHAEQETLREAISKLNTKRPRNVTETSVENYYRKFLFNEPNTVGNFDVGGTIYTTLEPCPFCTSALLVTRMKRIAYIIPDSKYGASFPYLKDNYYKTYDITYEPLSLNHNIHSEIINFGVIQLQYLLKYAADNPNINGTLILDNLNAFLEECSGFFIKLTESSLITTGTEKQRNFLTLKGLQAKLE